MASPPASFAQFVFRFAATAALALMLAPFALSLQGCTILGLAAGSAADHDLSGRGLPPEQMLAIRPGAMLGLRLDDGTTLEGKYLGRRLLSDEEYAPRLADWARATAGPALGDTIELELLDGRRVRGRFDGFTIGSIELRDTTGDGRQTHALSTLRAMHHREWSRVVGSLSPMGARFEIPLRDVLSLRISDSGNYEEKGQVSRGIQGPSGPPKVLAIEAQRIRSVFPPGNHIAPVIGMLFGATADILIVRSLANQGPGCVLIAFPGSWSYRNSPYVTPIR